MFRTRFVVSPKGLTDCARTYGPISGFNILGRQTFLFDDPDAIEEVLVTKARYFKKGVGLQRMRILLGDGLLTSEEPLHLERRRVMQPAFHRKRLGTYAALMRRLSLNAMTAWRAGETRDVAADMPPLTLAIASEALFGATISHDADLIASAVTELLQLFPSMMGPLGPLRTRLPLPKTKRFEHLRTDLDGAIERLIAARRDTADASSDDVFGLLTSARLDDGSQLDANALRDECLTFILAGHETTANALAWTLYLLATHPEIQRELAAEIAAADLDAGAHTLEQLPKTHTAIKESMRLFPPAWVIGRMATEDVTIGGVALERGNIALVSPYVTQRNPKYYADPEQFRPERWRETRDLPRFAYFPFGGGNRVCIGEPFAWMEAVIVLATLLREWRFLPTAATGNAMQALVTLRPANGMPLRVERRFG
jgi:cytochrome P450